MEQSRQDDRECARSRIRAPHASAPLDVPGVDSECTPLSEAMWFGGDGVTGCESRILKCDVKFGMQCTASLRLL